MTRQWRYHSFAFAVALFALLFVWFDTLTHMSAILWSVDVFAHGLIAPVVTFALIFSRRNRLAAMDPSVSWIGPLLVFAASVGWAGGSVLDIALLRHLGLVTAVQGLVLTVFGWPVYRAILFPMLFLYFSVPFGYELVGPLQTMTASIVIAVLDVIGADFTAEGMIIELPSGLYEVAEACAGVKFLFTSFFTGVLLSHLVFKSWRRRAAIIVASIVLPIAANAIRVLLIFLIAEVSDQGLAKGFDHLVYGWVFLSIVLFALIAVAYRYSDEPLSSSLENMRQSDSERQALGGFHAAFAVLTAVGLPMLVGWLLPVTEAATAIRQPVVSAMYGDGAPQGYRLLPSNGLVVRPSFISADDQRAALLRRSGVVFHAYHARFNMLAAGKRLFQPGNSLASAEWKEIIGAGRDMEVAGRELRMREHLFWRGDDRTLIWSLHCVGGSAVTNGIEEKLETARRIIVGQQVPGDVWVLSAPLVDNGDSVRRIFSEFMSTFPSDSYLNEGGGPSAGDNGLCAE